MATVQGIYIALFGRPADPLGLDFYNGVTNNGQNLSGIQGLTGSAEYQARFTGQTNVQIVNSIYQSLFARDADLPGLTFYVGELQAGRLTIEQIAIAIYDGATGTDLATLQNKEEAANNFTAAIDTTEEVLAYSGDAAAAQGRAFLAPITSDDATVPTAAQTDAAVAALGTTGGAGEIFTLTPAGNTVTGGVDIVTGTAGDDNIRAIAANSLGSEDVIDGGAGFDTLNISAGAFATGAAPVISNVERINNAVTGANLDLTSVTGAQQIWSSGAAASYTNANINTVFGAQGAGPVGATIGFAGSLAGATTLQLTTAVTGGQTATFALATAAQAQAIEAVSINAASGNSVVALDVNLDTLATVTVTGAGRVQVNTLETTITTFDASATTGGVTFTSGALTAAATVTGGSGNDVLNFAAAVATAPVTINAGAGNDIITGGAGADTINAGEGNDIVNASLGADTITLGAGNDFVVYTAGGQSTGTTAAALDTITDFNVSGDDTINLSGIAGTEVLTSAQTLVLVQNAVDALAAGSTLQQAANAAFAAATTGGAGVNEVLHFQFGGNTYVGVDVGNTDTYVSGTDLLVELTGTVALSASDFVIA
jgi:hypothetical protein